MLLFLSSSSSAMAIKSYSLASPMWSCRLESLYQFGDADKINVLCEAQTLCNPSGNSIDHLGCFIFAGRHLEVGNGDHHLDMYHLDGTDL